MGAKVDDSRLIHCVAKRRDIRVQRKGRVGHPGGDVGVAQQGRRGVRGIGHRLDVAGICIWLAAPVRKAAKGEIRRAVGKQGSRSPCRASNHVPSRVERRDVKRTADGSRESACKIEIAVIPAATARKQERLTGIERQIREVLGINGVSGFSLDLDTAVAQNQIRSAHDDIIQVGGGGSRKRQV